MINMKLFNDLLNGQFDYFENDRIQMSFYVLSLMKKINIKHIIRDAVDLSNFTIMLTQANKILILSEEYQVIQLDDQPSIKGQIIKIQHYLNRNQNQFLLITNQYVYIAQITKQNQIQIKIKQIEIGYRSNHFNRIISIDKQNQQMMYVSRLNKNQIYFNIYDLMELKMIKEETIKVNHTLNISAECPYIFGYNSQLLKHKVLQIHNLIEEKIHKIASIHNNISILRIHPMIRDTCAIIANSVDKDQIIVWVYNLSIGYTVNLLEFNGVAIQSKIYSQNQIIITQQLTERQHDQFEACRRGPIQYSIRLVDCFSTTQSSGQLHSFPISHQILDISDRFALLKINSELNSESNSVTTLEMYRKIPKKVIYCFMINQHTLNSKYTDQFLRQILQLL